MTRFTTFTSAELDTIQYVFCIALDNMGLGNSQQERVAKLVDEICAEKRCREKIKKEQSITGLLDFCDNRNKNEEIERHRALKNEMEQISMNSNYGVVTRSCEDDEKLVVLCMINKTLKDMQGTLEGMQETLARVDDKI